MTDHQLFEKVLGFLKQTIVYSNEEMVRLDELKKLVHDRLAQSVHASDEFAEMVKKGTKAWDGTPDDWVDELRGGAEKQEPVAFRNTETGEFCTGGFLRKDWAKWQPLYAAPVHAIDMSEKHVHESDKDRHKSYDPMERNVDYERGFIDGRADQMKSSVDRAVNRMAQREWVGLTDEEREQVRSSAGYNQFMSAGEYAKAVQLTTEAKLKEKNQ